MRRADKCSQVAYRFPPRNFKLVVRNPPGGGLEPAGVKFCETNIVTPANAS